MMRLGTRQIWGWHAMACGMILLLGRTSALGGADVNVLSLGTTTNCFNVGDSICVTVRVSELAEQCAGGQFFIVYDDTKLRFEAMAPGDHPDPGPGDGIEPCETPATSPYTDEVFEDASVSGAITYLTSIPFGGAPSDEVNVMATIRFTAIAEGIAFVGWDPAHLPDGDPPFVRLSTAKGDAIKPLTLFDLGAVYIDSTPPVIECQENRTIECDEPIPGPDCEATDNLDPDPPITCKDEIIPSGVCSQEFTIVRTCTATDICGNTSEPATYTITVDDSMGPEITMFPLDEDRQCNLNLPKPDCSLVDGIDNCDPDPQCMFLGDVSDGNICPEVITRMYELCDECGNCTSRDQIYTINDDTPPVIQCPDDLFLQCVSEIPEPDVNEVLAGDNCGQVVITKEEDTDNGGAGCIDDPFVKWRTYRATDACGNTSTCEQVITVVDDTPPELTIPPDMEVECEGGKECTDPVPDCTGEATAEDNCGMVVITHADEMIAGDCAVDQIWRTIVRTWTATDTCGNSTSMAQTITVVDTAPPVFTSFPSDAVVECAGGDECTDPPCTGEPTAEDNCSDVTITYEDVITPGDCPQEFTITRSWWATDACDNSVHQDQIIHVVDTTGPVFDSFPGTILVHADAGGCTATVDVMGPGAGDACDPGPIEVTCTRSDGLPCTDPYPEGVTTITWEACDACGNCNSVPQDIEVDSTNVFMAEVELSPGVYEADFTWCITFEFWNCPGDEPAAVVEVPVDFMNLAALDEGAFGVAVIDNFMADGEPYLPCGQYTCVTAYDAHHTLRRNDETLEIVDDGYVAGFVGDPAAGGDWLTTGDVSQEAACVIDLLDYEVILDQLFTVSTYMGCATPLDDRDGDLNGDGIVDGLDFDFVFTSLFATCETPCCDTEGLQGNETETLGIHTISVAELEVLLGYPPRGDLNGDGIVDLVDIELFRSGVRPVQVESPSIATDLRPKE